MKHSNRRSVDTLLALDKLDGAMVSGDGLLTCASLLASGLAEVDEKTEIVETSGGHGPYYHQRGSHYEILDGTQYEGTCICRRMEAGGPNDSRLRIILVTYAVRSH